MSLTMPQIIMLNHGAWVNNKRSESKSKKAPEEQEELYKGKKVSELNTEDFKAYINDWG